MAMLSRAPTHANMIELLLLPVLAGIGLALVSGTLGCFIVWRQMSFLGDTLAHSALLGVALSIALKWNVTISMIVVSVILAILLLKLESQRHLSRDALLSILSHSSLAIGVILVGFFAQSNINLNAFLFGDLLTVSMIETLEIYFLSATALLLLIRYWKPLLAITADESLARVEGIKVDALKILLALITAVIVAVAINIVGVLLVSALLVIPAAAARNIALSPETQAGAATFIALISVLLGISASVMFDTPVGPSMIAFTFVIFVFTFILTQKKGA